MDQIAISNSKLEALRTELAKVLIGQAGLVDRILIGILTGGHLLIEGVPGLAKTLAARSIAAALGLEFHRVQFTPDLLPADLIGTEIYNPRTAEFTVRKGPIFCQVLLADEINRSPAKVQSALLEAMQERQVTIGLETFPLARPFLVLATQNPIEHEGTYPLPEAQLDRFLLKVLVDYPEKAEELRIMNQNAVTTPRGDVRAVLNIQEVLALQSTVDQVHLDEKIGEYILNIVRSTRQNQTSSLQNTSWIELGASPRASIGLALAAKGYALLQGRNYVVPHDVKSIAKDVLRHRILLSFEAESAEMSADVVLDKLIAEIAVP